MLSLFFLWSLAFQPARVVAADGHWAALEREGACSASAASLNAAPKGRAQAHASLTFDAVGRRNGELAVLLSRTPRPGSSVMLTIGEMPFLLVARGDLAWSSGPRQEAAIIAAMRAAPSMRVEARSAAGGRIVDRYLLAGAPTAIDAAAACAARLDRR